MTSSPRSASTLHAVHPSLRSASPLLRSAAASSTSSLSSVFQFASTDIDLLSLPSEETRAHQAIISQAFGPTVAVVASRECEEMIRAKGFANLLDLLRPFGDSIQGKVNIRDSQAMTLSIEDFSVKFIDFHHYAQSLSNGRDAREQGPYAPKRTHPNYIPGGDLAALERLMEHYVGLAQDNQGENGESKAGGDGKREGAYSFFLRRMLSAFPMSAHESFLHPVACVLAVSSHHTEPIDALLGLYNTTNNAPMPRFIDEAFLRYYVLIHDEDKDDIDKSNEILERMKRSLGIHCAILQINTVHDEKEGIPIGKSSWVSAGEELAYLMNPRAVPTISSVDKENLHKFTRDLVAQSVVPHMERCITIWNDQIASYRRGLAGRVFTASRRLFGGSSRSATPTSGSGNYDISTSSYPPSTPEAQMRKLADYAFMLRDWRLAHSTYDIVRKDFANDKAWKYAAGAQEMTAITMLLLQSPLTPLKMIETLDPLLDSALYSYTARSSLPYFSLRTILISIELLTLKGGIAPDEAVKWAGKALGSGSLGDIGTCLLVERIASCYKVMHPRRRRKMALWSMLACESWVGVGCRGFAIRCLREAWDVYKDCEGFSRIGGHMAGLMETLGIQKDVGEKAMEIVDMQHDGEAPQPQPQEEIRVEFA